MSRIDTSTPAPPAKLWRSTRDRVRSDRPLVVPVHPVAWVRYANGDACGLKDERGTYHSLDDLFPTEEAAYTWARECAAIEYAHEKEKFEALSKRIAASFHAAERHLAQLKAATTEGTPA